MSTIYEKDPRYKGSEVKGFLINWLNKIAGVGEWKKESLDDALGAAYLYFLRHPKASVRDCGNAGIRAVRLSKKKYDKKIFKGGEFDALAEDIELPGREKILETIWVFPTRSALTARLAKERKEENYRARVALAAGRLAMQHGTPGATELVKMVKRSGFDINTLEFLKKHPILVQYLTFADKNITAELKTRPDFMEKLQISLRTFERRLSAGEFARVAGWGDDGIYAFGLKRYDGFKEMVTDIIGIKPKPVQIAFNF